jgi:hypothetical protein
MNLKYVASWGVAAFSLLSCYPREVNIALIYSSAARGAANGGSAVGGMVRKMFKNKIFVFSKTNGNAFRCQYYYAPCGT